MQRAPLKIEELLNRAGSTEIPDDVTHRYDLRRSLLCSRYFTVEFERQEKWNRFMTFTIPLFAGGMLVIVFSVVGASMGEPRAPISVHTPSYSAVAANTEPVQIEEDQSPFIDKTGIQPLYEEVKFSPVRTASFVMMQ
ncbi:MAG: hypothetical protein AAB431_01850 [Patescibacteria group bacterium]